MKHIKKMAAILIVLTLFVTAAFSAMAESTKKDSKASEVSSASESVKTDDNKTAEGGVDLATAAPEEIEDIGMAAMIEAGLVSGSDVSIVDVTPDDTSSTKAEAQNSVASALGIAGFIISIISFVGMCVLYFLCWKNGLLKINTKNK